MGCLSCSKSSGAKTQRPATPTASSTKRIVSSASSLYGSPKVRMSFSSKKRD